MTTIISQNLKKTSDVIDINGNKIDLRTKSIIEPVEQEYIPTKEEMDKAFKRTPKEESKPSETNPIETTGLSEKIGSKIDQIIEKKIDELVAKKIEEALNKL